jgi:hypothetical protein
MKHAVDALLVEEASVFQLRFSCEHCAHFVQSNAGCAEGYPNEEHRTNPLQVGGTVTFCKLFELS